MNDENYFQQPSADVPSSPDLIKEIALPIYKSKAWLRLIGILSVLYGIFMLISLIGVFICWLPIWIGVLLFQASGAFENAVETGEKEELIVAMNKLRLYFVIMGILALIGITGLMGVYLSVMAQL